MGWQDRPYYRDRPPGDRQPADVAAHRVGAAVHGVRHPRPRARVADRAHRARAAVRLGGPGGIGPGHACRAMAILFVSVLLHEFGHCFAARWIGGEADEILMTPLGGLALADAAAAAAGRAFVTVAGGPLVNVVICLVTGVAPVIVSRSAAAADPVVPVRPTALQELSSRLTGRHVATSSGSSWSATRCCCSTCCRSSTRSTAGRSSRRSCGCSSATTSRCCSRRTSAWSARCCGRSARRGSAFGSLMLILIASFGFMTCYQQRQHAARSRPVGVQEEDSRRLRREPAARRRRAVRKPEPLQPLVRRPRQEARAGGGRPSRRRSTRSSPRSPPTACTASPGSRSAPSARPPSGSASATWKPAAAGGGRGADRKEKRGKGTRGQDEQRTAALPSLHPQFSILASLPSSLRAPSRPSRTKRSFAAAARAGQLSRGGSPALVRSGVASGLGVPRRRPAASRAPRRRTGRGPSRRCRSRRTRRATCTSAPASSLARSPSAGSQPVRQSSIRAAHQSSAASL